MGFFDISVSCFDDCHIIKFGCCCGCLSVIKTIYQTIIFEQIFFAHNNNYYIIVQGQGGIKGWDLILHIVYLSSRLYVRAVEYFSHIEHNNANTCGGTPGGNVDTHSPILPCVLMKLFEIIRLFPALTEHIWKHLKLSEYIWNYFDDFLKLSEIIRHCLKILDTIKN